MSSLRPGRIIRAALSIEYIPDEPRENSSEGLEFLLEGGGSVVATNATDWTLVMSEGRWPELPSWCWPVEEWRYGNIDIIGSPGFNEILNVSNIYNSVDELHGQVVSFRDGSISIRAGDDMTWDIRSL